MNTFLEALSIQWRVIWALVMRETITKFGNSKLGFFWALVEHASFLVIFMVIFAIIGRSSPIPGDLYMFFLTALVPFLMFKSVMSKTATAGTANQALLTYPQVTPFDTKMARLILEFTISVFVGFLTYFVLFQTGLTKIVVDDPLSFLLGLINLGIFAFAVGLIFSGIIAYWPVFANLYGPLTTRPLLLTSGIFFLPEQVPYPYGEYLYYNPLARFIAWMRSAFYPNFDSDYGYSINLVYITIITLAVGLAIDKVVEKRRRVSI